MRLKNWKIRDGKLYLKIKFKDFSEAFSFLTRVAIEAEKLNHHPEIHNVYNEVELYLITHDKNSITNLDYELAKRINKILKS